MNQKFSSVQLVSCVWLLVTPWTAARQASLSITNSCPSNRSVHPTSTSKLQLLSIKSVMPSNHLILCHPLLLLPSIFPSIRVFSNELVLHIRWPKDWSFSFSISPPNEYSGLISFRMDWLDLLAVWGLLKSLLQHHSSKASILQHSAFFIVQLSYPYMTTEQTTALTRWTFHFGMKSISCPISKQRMLQPLSHHFAAPSLVNPEGTQDGDKECPPSGNQLLQPPARVHPEETQDEKAQDTGPR